MATIKAFKGLRPKKGLEDKIASLPYDVLNSQEARDLAKGNQYSFYHINKPEIDLDKNINLYDKRVYEKGRDNLKLFQKNEWLMQDKEDYLYIYKQKMGSHEQYGLVACASCDDYDNDIIKKHEFTRKDKEDDRTNHVNITGANAGPVFLTYKAQKSIDTLINNFIVAKTPTYDFTSEDNIGHTLWRIKDKPLIDDLIAAFRKVDFLYVADGHHRAASGSRTRALRKNNNPNHNGTEEYNYFLTALFPDNQLQILPYNRAIKNLNGLSQEAFLEKIKDSYNISKADQKEPIEPHTVCMYLGGTWYSLCMKEHIISKDDVIASLDVHILQHTLLSPILGIHDPRTSDKISFIGGIRGVKELETLVDSGDYIAAFSMFPVQVNDIIKVADTGKVMPPKSTWFEPKLRSGLIIHLLD